MAARASLMRCRPSSRSVFFTCQASWQGSILPVPALLACKSLLTCQTSWQGSPRDLGNEKAGSLVATMLAAARRAAIISQRSLRRDVGCLLSSNCAARDFLAWCWRSRSAGACAACRDSSSSLFQHGGTGQTVTVEQPTGKLATVDGRKPFPVQRVICQTLPSPVDGRSRPSMLHPARGRDEKLPRRGHDIPTDDH